MRINDLIFDEILRDENYTEIADYGTVTIILFLWHDVNDVIHTNVASRTMNAIVRKIDQ